MDNKELIEAIREVVAGIPFCQEGEENGLRQLGMLLAAPEKGLHNYRLYKAACEGKRPEEERKRLSHWELYGGELAAAAFCAMVYGGRKRFILDTRKENPAERLWNFVGRRKWDKLVLRLEKEKYKEEDVALFLKEMEWLEHAVAFGVIGTYTLYIDSYCRPPVGVYDIKVVKAYPAGYLRQEKDTFGFRKDRRHPFVAHAMEELRTGAGGRRRGNFEQCGCFLQMMEGLAVCAGKSKWLKDMAFLS